MIEGKNEERNNLKMRNDKEGRKGKREKEKKRDWT
jgi:hypothetical protein